MTDVFISYKHRLRDRVAQIAEALRALDVDVWYDEGLISGDDYAGAISEQLRAARCVVVAWTPDVFPPADRHGWVRGEAQKGRDRDVLVAVMLEPTDLDPPWNTVQYENLAEWTPGTADRTNWRRTLRAIGVLIGRPGLADYDKAQSAGTVTALTDWAREFAEDPLVPAVWQQIEDLEIAATRARLALERERKPAEPTPKPRPVPPVAPPPIQPPPVQRPVVDEAPPAPDPAPSPAPGPTRPTQSMLPVMAVAIVSAIASILAAFVLNSGPDIRSYIVFIGPPVATLAYAVALWAGGILTVRFAIILSVAMLVVCTVGLFLMFSLFSQYSVLSDPYMEVFATLVLAGPPLAVGLIVIGWSARARIDGVDLFGAVMIGVVGGVAMGFVAMLDEFSLVRGNDNFPALGPIWQIAFVIGINWLRQPRSGGGR